MTSRIDIINRALTMIGAAKISSLSDGTAEAEAATIIYPGVVEDLISRYRWRFAHVQKQLSRLTDSPDARWDAAYQLPSDCEILETVTVNDHPIPYDRIEDKVVCNATPDETVIAEYILVNDETRWPGYFTALLVFELAHTLAVPIGDRNDLSQALEKKALRQFSLARNLDSQGVTAKKFRTNAFRAWRNGRTAR